MYIQCYLNIIDLLKQYKDYYVPEHFKSVCTICFLMTGFPYSCVCYNIFLSLICFKPVLLNLLFKVYFYNFIRKDIFLIFKCPVNRLMQCFIWNYLISNHKNTHYQLYFDNLTYSVSTVNISLHSSIFNVYLIEPIPLFVKIADTLIIQCLLIQQTYIIVSKRSCVFTQIILQSYVLFKVKNKL